MTDKPTLRDEMNNPVFAVITREGGYKYQTEIVENELITRLIVDTAYKHGVINYTSKVYDANVFDWLEISEEQGTNPEVIPLEYLPSEAKTNKGSMIKHRKKGLPRIQLDENHLPPKWQEKLIENQEIGGVFLVFLSGKDKAEIRKKVKHLKQFCKTITDFATVEPVKEQSK